MPYIKQLQTPSLSRSRLTFSDFSGGIRVDRDENLLPQRYAAECFNVTGASGALKSFGGVSVFTLGDKTFTLSLGLQDLFAFNRYDRDRNQQDDRLVAQATNGALYAAPLYGKGGFTSLGVTRTGKLSAVNYRLNGEDVILISSPTRPLLVWDGVNAPYEASGAPNITSMCVHYERLFVTTAGDKSELWFSDDLDVTNWHISLDEAGFIQFADEGGGLQRAVRFLDYVYLFRTYGISRVTAYAEQTQFRVSKLYQSAGKIYPNTVTVCGDRILFLSDEGLFSFDGLDAVKLTDATDNLLASNQQNAISCRKGGTWYLGAWLNFRTTIDIDESDFCNNALLCYDSQTKKLDIMRGFDVRALCGLEAEEVSAALIVTDENQKVGKISDTGKHYDNALIKRWITPYTDLGQAEKKKAVRAVYLVGNGNVDVAVESDSGGEVHTFYGSDGRRYRQKGKRFRLRFESLSDSFLISKPQVLADKRES